jgi:hypothetical protein
MTATTDTLARLPEEDRGRLFPLLADGPAIVEKLTGRRPHKSAFYKREVRQWHSSRSVTRWWCRARRPAS